MLRASGCCSALRRRSLSNGSRLRVRPASAPQVRRVLELTGVGPLLPIET
ncbi:MAG TPA: hypothetical protein VFN72_11430 [Solirubrobacterales bacterium]|nr:hypothetical protein [Solirubrobacterales bacterium]